MSFDIRIDYRFDSTGFFDPTTADGAAARAALERAVGIWEGILLDEFEDVPAGIAFEIDDPSAAGTARRVVLEEAIDDLLLFVGAEAQGGPVAIGGFDGTGIGGIGLGDALSARVSGDFRDQGPVTDFEPWVGTVAYDPTVDWSFDLEVADRERVDFVSVSLHEIGHVLGFGTAGIFDQLGGIGTESDGQFMGLNAMRVNGGEPVPLQVGRGHVVEGFGMNQVLMDPSLTRGNRLVPSEIDKAILADIGWEIAGFETQGAAPPLATDGPERIFGTILGDTLDGLDGADTVQGRGGDDDLSGGAGDDTLIGGAGNDTLAGGAGDDQVQGGEGDDLLLAGPGDDALFGQDGTDTFRISGGGGQIRITGMELATERVEIENSGFATDATALAAIEKPFGNVSRLTFADGTRIDIFHDSQQGTPLTLANLRVLDPVLGPETISGDDGPDDLTGTRAAELILGLGGDDTLEGGAGADRLVGGPGDDLYLADRSDTVVEAAGQGRDTLTSDGPVVLRGAEIEVVTLTGTANARVTGNGTATEITGNAGANVLIGGGGGDVLTGGGGADVFAFLAADLAGAAARIVDFETGDRLALDDRLFGLGDGRVDARDVTQVQVRAAIQNERAVYDGATGALSVDLDGRGPEAAQLLMTIEGGGRIDAEDLLLF